MTVDSAEKWVGQLSDDDLSLILEGKAVKLRNGQKTRAEILGELASLMAGMDGSLVADGPIKSHGRLSFGRAHEGADGVGLFIPADYLSDQLRADMGVDQ